MPSQMVVLVGDGTLVEVVEVVDDVLVVVVGAGATGDSTSTT